MKQYICTITGLTVREFSDSPTLLPSLKFQLGETCIVRRTAEPSKFLPNGYDLNVPIFHVKAHGETLLQAKARLH